MGEIDDLHSVLNCMDEIIPFKMESSDESIPILDVLVKT